MSEARSIVLQARGVCKRFREGRLDVTALRTQRAITIPLVRAMLATD